MVIQVSVWKNASEVRLTGHGLRFEERFALTDSISILPSVEPLDPYSLEKCDTNIERTSIETMHDIATFTIEVTAAEGGVDLANAGWASLWDFHLLSLAGNAPSFMLYGASGLPPKVLYFVANRNLILSPLADLASISSDQLEWGRRYRPSFRELIKNQQFSAAMRYFGNAHYLFDLEHRIMLLWAGIEGLLMVDAEHSRRIALYSSILLHGDAEAKFERFEMVKKSYSLRSRVVHGSKPNKEKLQQGYAEATHLLSDLLRRCVELGRVPSRQELDRASYVGNLE